MAEPKDELPEEEAPTLQMKEGRVWTEDSLTIVKLHSEKKPETSAPAGQESKVFWLFRALEEMNLPVLMALLIQKTQINVRDFGRFTPDDPETLKVIQEALEELFPMLALMSAKEELTRRQLWPLL